MNVRARARAGEKAQAWAFFFFVHHDYEVTTARTKKDFDCPSLSTSIIGC